MPRAASWFVGAVILAIGLIVGYLQPFEPASVPKPRHQPSHDHECKHSHHSTHTEVSPVRCPAQPDVLNVGGEWASVLWG